MASKECFKYDAVWTSNNREWSVRRIEDRSTKEYKPSQCEETDRIIFTTKKGKCLVLFRSSITYIRYHNNFMYIGMLNSEEKDFGKVERSDLFTGVLVNKNNGTRLEGVDLDAFLEFSEPTTLEPDETRDCTSYVIFNPKHVPELELCQSFVSFCYPRQGGWKCVLELKITDELMTFLIRVFRLPKDFKSYYQEGCFYSDSDSDSDLDDDDLSEPEPEPEKDFCLIRDDDEEMVAVNPSEEEEEVKNYLKSK